MDDDKKVLGLLGLAKRAGKLVVGSQATKEALVRNRLSLLIFSLDAANGTTRKFEMLANQKGIPILRVSSKGPLGRAIGKESVSILGISDESFAAALSRIV